MSEKVIVTLGVSTSQISTDIAELEAQAVQFTKRWNTIFRVTQQQIISATRQLAAVTGVISQMANLMGESLGPAFQALIITVQSASAALSSIATAYNLSGVGTVAAAIISVSVFTLNLKAMGALLAGQDEVAAELTKMRGLADSVNILIGQLG